MVIDEFLEVGWFLDSHVTVLVCDHDIKADVFTLVPPSLSKFVLLNICDYLVSPNYFGDLEDLVDTIIPLHKWRLPKNLQSAR